MACSFSYSVTLWFQWYCMKTYLLSHSVYSVEHSQHRTAYARATCAQWSMRPLCPDRRGRLQTSADTQGASLCLRYRWQICTHLLTKWGTSIPGNRCLFTRVLAVLILSVSRAHHMAWYAVSVFPSVSPSICLLARTDTIGPTGTISNLEIPYDNDI